MTVESKELTNARLCAMTAFGKKMLVKVDDNEVRDCTELARTITQKLGTP